MTIKNLWKFIRSKCSCVYEEIDCSIMSGCIVAVDANLMLYKYYCVSLKLTDGSVDDMCLFMFVRFINEMLTLGIKLVIVYDGTRLYDKRDRTSSTRISNELISRSRHILDKISIPNMISRYDGEGLCCWLYRSGLVDAVYSSDGDNLAYGCSTLIVSKTKFKFTLVRLSNILEQLDISYSQFLDLCIMSGCDYNTNIYNVGVSKCYDLIVRYGCFSNIVQNYPDCDFDCLRYSRCIEIFTCFSCVDGIELPDLNFSANKDLIKYIVQTKSLDI